MQQKNTVQFVNKFWKDSVIPALSDFIRIPCKSPAFDNNWQKNGYLIKAAKLMAAWAEAQKIPGLKSKIIQAAGKSPVLYIEIPGKTKDGTLFYGHLDKMPEATGWDKKLGAWKPVVKNNRLYGRGSVDDGYAFFSAIAAIKTLDEQKISYSKCVIILEACEESDYPDLHHYLKQLRQSIGKINTVICLDTSAYDYQRLWCTTALRGIVKAILTVTVLKKEAHSGSAGGIIPSSFRILRQLLARIEDANTGKILLKSCYTKIPSSYKKEAKLIAKIAGKAIYTGFPLTKTIRPITNNLAELLLNQSWRPTLSVIGAEGLPNIENAGAAIRPQTTIMMGIRLPPFCSPQRVAKELKKVLTSNPPYGATIDLTIAAEVNGWAATKTQPWLKHAINKASKTYFGNNSLNLCCGGAIGAASLFASVFPKANLVLAGICGPNSNEHAANESLYLPAAQKLTCCLAHILAEHYIYAKK